MRLLKKQSLTPNQSVFGALSLCKTWNDFCASLWTDKIRSESDKRYALFVESKYPGCILTVHLAQRRLDELEIPIEFIYVGAKSNVVIIEINANKRKAQRLNQQIKHDLAPLQTCGWLIVEKEYQENGDEEQLSLR